MDFERPQQPEAPAPAPMSQFTPKRRRFNGKKLLMWLVMLAVVGGAAYAGYYYADRQAKDKQQDQTREIAKLKLQITQLKYDLNSLNASQSTITPPSTDDLANITAAVKSGNYAALEGLMTPKVTVIIAASEGVGERTPVQAISDIKYLNAGTDPWNFALPQATVDGYAAGDYAKYFPDGALVGKAANGYVVSFSFNSSGKISTIFMSVNEDVL